MNRDEFVLELNKVKEEEIKRELQLCVKITGKTVYELLDKVIKEASTSIRTFEPLVIDHLWSNQRSVTIEEYEELTDRIKQYCVREYKYVDVIVKVMWIFKKKVERERHIGYRTYEHIGMNDFKHMYNNIVVYLEEKGFQAEKYRTSNNWNFVYDAIKLYWSNDLTE